MSLAGQDRILLTRTVGAGVRGGVGETAPQVGQVVLALGRRGDDDAIEKAVRA